MFHLFSLLRIWQKYKADDVEPNYTDDSTCIQEAENGTCEVQWDGLETSIGVPEWYNAYIHTKSTAVVFTEEDL